MAFVKLRMQATAHVLLAAALQAAAMLVYYLAGNAALVPETEVRPAGIVVGASAGTQKDRIALLEPTFTYAAYQNGSFYNFYHLYRTVPRAENVTTNLDLLVDSPVSSGPFIHYKAPEKGLTTPHTHIHRAPQGGRAARQGVCLLLTPISQNLEISTSAMDPYSTQTAPTRTMS